MGQLREEIFRFGRDLHGLGADARDEIRTRLVELVQAIRKVLTAHRANLGRTEWRWLTDTVPEFYQDLVECLEHTLGEKLTQEERRKLCDVPFSWELISIPLCQFARLPELASRDDYRLAQEFYRIIAGFDQIAFCDRIGRSGERYAEVLDDAAERLGLRQDDPRIEKGVHLAAALILLAVVQMDATVALGKVTNTAMYPYELNPKAIEQAVGFFGPNKALEKDLQEVRYGSADRAHLDRVSLIEAWEKMGEHVRRRELLWPRQIAGHVRRALRQTYLGEAGRPDREETRDLSQDDAGEDEFADRAGSVVESAALKHRLLRHLDRLSPAEREAVLEVYQALKEGSVTYSGKHDDSLRELWGRDYERKRRSFSRARRKLRELDSNSAD